MTSPNRYSATDDLVSAVINQESGGDTSAVSPKGAQGLMQLMPDTAREVAGKLGLPFDEGRLRSDPDYNKQLGTAYLNQQLDRYQGNTALALAAYNGGMGNVDKWLKDIGDPRTGQVTEQDFVDRIPFGETRDYVKRIMGAVGTQRPLSDAVGDLGTSFPVTNDEATQARLAAEEDGSGFWDDAWEAAKDNQTITWMLRGNEEFLPDTSFDITEDAVVELGKGIPSEYWDEFSGATSAAHAQYIRQGLLDRLESQQQIASLGWTGVGISVLSALLDPVAIAAGAATGGLGAIAMKGRVVSRLARAAYGGVSGAAIEAGLSAYQVSKDPIGDEKQILWAALGGLAVGAGFGAWSAPREVQDGAARIAAAARRGQDALEEALGDGRGTAGAAEAGGDFGTSPLRDKTLAYLSIPESDAPRSVAPGARFDVANEGKSSPNAATRALTERMVEDPVGNLDRSVVAAEHASTVAMQIRNRIETEVARSVVPAFDAWAKEAGLGYIAKKRAFRDFDEMVGKFIRDRDPTGDYPPQVRAAGEAIRKAFGDYHALLRDPGLIDGSVKRSVAGFENIEPNRFYLPRIHDHFKMSQAMAEHGEGPMRALIRRAISDVQPDIEERLLDRLSAGYLKRVRELGAGMEIDFSRAWSGNDLDLLREELTAIPEMSQEEVDSIMRLLARDREGASSRGKERLFMNEKASITYRHADGRTKTLSVEDVLSNEAYSLLKSYGRGMAGHIAMARVQINDAWGDLLVNGITSRSEFATYLSEVKAVAERLSLTEGRRAQDITSLQWMYDRVTGVPDSSQTTKIAEYLRLARAVNFLRVMNQSGFAQVAEAASIIGHTGIVAAFRAMPGLRMLRRQIIDGRLEIADELGAELEAGLGEGGERLRAVLDARWDDEVGRYTSKVESKLFHAADNTARQLQHVTADISLLAPVNTFLKRWAASAAVHKFAALATKPTKANMNRMRVLGISEDMLERILGELRSHASWKSGQLGKVRRVNFDKWTDLEARAKFEQAIIQWSRRAVQENDFGGQARFMSNAFAQIFTQFRTFMLGAWTKQLLHNIHMRDANTFGIFAGTMVFGGLTYMLQTNLQAIGRSDRREFLEERLSDANIAKAAFQRAGFSSLFPMLADTALQLLGQDKQFDFRTTGQSSDMLFGNPSFDLLDNTIKGIGGLVGSATDSERDFTQNDARSLLRLLPFGNFLPIQQTFNAIISDLPEKK